jgi:hypothetical protein
MSTRLLLTGADKRIIVAGWSLVGLGLVCNPLVLAVAFSPDGILEVETKVIIGFFELMLVLAGLTLMHYRKCVSLADLTLRLSRAYPRLVALCFGMVLSLLFLLSAEGLFYVLNTLKHPAERGMERTDSARFLEEDAWLGYKSVPNVRVVSRKAYKGQILYEARYSTDAYGRRITPIERPEERRRFLLFFGDSFMFGQGVNDEETLPCYVAQLAPHYRPYNYGVVGYGPQSMLATLQRDTFAREITEPQGMLVYLFNDDQIPRAVGSMRVHNAWAHHLPFYTLDAQHRLVRRGNFTSGRPLVAWFYWALGASQMARYFGVDFPRTLTEEHFTLTARILAEARDAFRRTFHSDRFYVLLYPGSKRAKRLIPALVQAGIPYLDYTALFDPHQPAFHIVGDGHPTPTAHRTVATRVAHDLGLMNEPTP